MSWLYYGLGALLAFSIALVIAWAFLLLSEDPEAVAEALSQVKPGWWR